MVVKEVSGMTMFIKPRGQFAQMSRSEILAISLKRKKDEIGILPIVFRLIESRDGEESEGEAFVGT